MKLIACRCVTPRALPLGLLIRAPSLLPSSPSLLSQAFRHSLHPLLTTDPHSTYIYFSDSLPPSACSGADGVTSQSVSQKGNILYYIFLWAAAVAGPPEHVLSLPCEPRPRSPLWVARPVASPSPPGASPPDPARCPSARPRRGLLGSPEGLGGPKSPPRSAPACGLSSQARRPHPTLPSSSPPPSPLGTRPTPPTS